MNFFHVWTHDAAHMHFILHCSHGDFQPFIKQMMAGIHTAKSEFKLRDPKDLLTAGAVVEYAWQTLSYLSRNTVLANNCVRSIQKQQLVLKKRNNSNKIKSPGRKCCRHRVSALQSRWDDWVSIAMCPTSLRGWIIHQGGWIITAEKWRNLSHCQPCRSSLEKFENISEL